MSAPDFIRSTTLVEVAAREAFRIFTEEVDAWWGQGPRFRWHPERGGRVCFEPGPQGRLVEVYEDASGGEFEVGRVRVWDPPKRLVFGFRARNFARNQSTEVEVRFETEGAGTRVTVEHRGWDALPADHPARHGMDEGAFRGTMGLWWADLLNAMKRRSAA